MPVRGHPAARGHCIALEQRGGVAITDQPGWNSGMPPPHTKPTMEPPSLATYPEIGCTTILWELTHLCQRLSILRLELSNGLPSEKVPGDDGGVFWGNQHQTLNVSLFWIFYAHRTYGSSTLLKEAHDRFIE